MEFIAENYIWFIIGGIIILMAVVGYIADITDFGRKKFDSQIKEKPKKEKKEKVKKEKKEKIVEQPSLEQNDNIETNIFNEIEMPVSPIEQPEVIENGSEQLNSFEPINEEVNLFVEEPVEESVEETTEEQVDQSLFAPLPGMEQPFGENVDNELKNEEVTNELEVQNESEIQSDDDIWKF